MAWPPSGIGGGGSPIDTPPVFDNPILPDPPITGSGGGGGGPGGEFILRIVILMGSCYLVQEK